MASFHLSYLPNVLSYLPNDLSFAHCKAFWWGVLTVVVCRHMHTHVCIHAQKCTGVFFVPIATAVARQDQPSLHVLDADKKSLHH